MLFSNSTLACCSMVLNTAVQGFGTWAMLSELASAGIAYLERDEVAPKEQKNAYLVQIIGYGISTATLFLALSCRCMGGMHSGFGSLALTSGSVGFVGSFVGYSQNSDKNLLTQSAFYSSVLGISTHLFSTILAIIMQRNLRAAQGEAAIPLGV